MRHSLSVTSCALVAAFLLASLPAATQAQSLWLNWRPDKTLTLEILKPDFDGEDNSTFTTSVLFLALRQPIGDRAMLVAELPFAHAGWDSRFGGDESDNTLGNPYAGFEIYNQNASFIAEVGLRVPVADEEKSATYVGLLTEITERYDAFAPKFLPLTAFMNYRYQAPTGFVLRLRGGPAFWINTDKDRYEDGTEFFLNYSAQVGYESNRFDLLGGFSGRALVSEEDLDARERTVHQLGLAATVTLGSVRPGMQVRIPLDEDVTEMLDAVFGLHFGIVLQ